MYAHCLLFAALIFSPFSPSAHPQRDAARSRGITVVERLRSELLSVLGNEAVAAQAAGLRAQRANPYLTRASDDVSPAKRRIENLDGLPGPRPSFRRASSCWWLWLLFGVDVCQ